MGKYLALLILLFTNLFLANPVLAVVDPLAVPNNRFGIHLIQATQDESSPAASLVNSSGGDWGYITVLIEGKDKNRDKWQTFFNDLRRRHLIPLVRLATSPESGGFWKRPDIGEASVWADFLDSLNWPTKNRYVIIYNEPNHGAEWGNSVDAKDYAKTLDATITALKKKSEDFFVLNAGLDASTPNQPPAYLDELSFLQQMEEQVPGIFEKLDGWVSHSYPNPGFVSSPDNVGKGTVRTWFWEIQVLRNLGVSKNLPIFVAETGWKHAEGLKYDPSLPDENTLSDYYQNAFSNAWNSQRIVAVTPFLLSYQEAPFDHFSFKKITGQAQKQKLDAGPGVLGTQYPEYYAFYDAIKNMPKQVGKPVQENKALLIKGEVYSSIVASQTYEIKITFKNTGQSIWDSSTKLVPLESGKELGMETVSVEQGQLVEPEKEYTFKLNLKAPQKGNFKVKLNLFSDNKEFDTKPLEFVTEVKSPVILEVLTKLKWKESSAGDYILKVSGAVGDLEQKVTIDSNGKSENLEAKYLLPDYDFDFTLEKPNYHSKTIRQRVSQGVNTLDFGELQPTLFQNLIHPSTLWSLMPWSK